jgi:hypothetical protein
MYSAISEQDQPWSQREVEKLREDVAVFEARYVALEQQNRRSSPLMQKLGRYFGFGAAGKLDWARFKLNFKQEQLASYETQLASGDVITHRSGTAPESQPTAAARETARQKMERMITENPAALEPHIRRVYQPLIETEQR